MPKAPRSAQARRYLSSISDLEIGDVAFLAIDAVREGYDHVVFVSRYASVRETPDSRFHVRIRRSGPNRFEIRLPLGHKFPLRSTRTANSIEPEFTMERYDIPRTSPEQEVGKLLGKAVASLFR